MTTMDELPRGDSALLLRRQLRGVRASRGTWRSRVFAKWQVGAFAAAWLSITVSHSLWSALVLMVPAIVMAPTIAGRDRGIDPAQPKPAPSPRVSTSV